MEKTQGQSVDGEDDHWVVKCPHCEKEYEYIGYFDPDDVTDCLCGTKFNTTRVWIDDEKYIE